MSLLLTLLCVSALPVGRSAPSPRPYPAVEFEELLPRVLADDVLLIDVRNRSELLDPGRIPNSLNLPLPELERALAMSPGEFFDRYGFVLPAPDQEMVLTCRSGRRIQTAAARLIPDGYTNVRLFYDSYKGWVGRGAPVSRQLAPEELVSRLEDDSQQVLDLRPRVARRKRQVGYLQPVEGSNALSIDELDLALRLTPGQFREKFGFEKPPQEAPLTVIAEDENQTLDSLELLNGHGYYDLGLYFGPLQEWLPEKDAPLVSGTIDTTSTTDTK
ncbi:Thiosulfate sulfurtransferase/rhodanese-like domain-containing protein 3 [Amphibalanus amphitrite]|uniref:Thiosulfate sulfurtransferase/rhodanese-like domain-containing protein 3 n=1 Tax=Amphibalanus amphitrite TaxID=1232801 RepID=A0A6A4WAI6_AMPAM|nr:Thiosulfate sulfurtransferase/rhodanese-like domain-containing protein 3 [Amphibalanus amphitrite]